MLCIGPDHAATYSSLLSTNSPFMNLAGVVVAVPDDQGVPRMLVALAFGSFEVSVHLGLEGVGEHLLGSLAGDLVEVERELLTWELIVMYSLHRCILPAEVGASAVPFDYSKGRYTTSLGKSTIHSFRLYLCNPSYLSSLINWAGLIP